MDSTSAKTLNDRAAAWLAVCDALTAVVPGWQGDGKNGMEAAVSTICALAGTHIPLLTAPAPQADQNKDVAWLLDCAETAKTDPAIATAIRDICKAMAKAELTAVPAPQTDADKLIAEACAVFDLMCEGCRESGFGDYENGHGETIGPRMDALHAKLRAYPAAPAPQQSEVLSDEDIQIIWQTMPGGPAGWLKSFGYLQFAREVEREVRATQAATAAPVPPIVREAIEATFEQRPGFLTKVAAAVRALDATEAPVQAEPVAWMRNSGKECKTAAEKKHMEGLDFGLWKEVAASYTIPLYLAPSLHLSEQEVRDQALIAARVEIAMLAKPDGDPTYLAALKDAAAVVGALLTSTSQASEAGDA